MFTKKRMYNDQWTRWTDDMFIRDLHEFATRENRRLTVEDYEILLTIGKRLEKWSKFEFTLDDLKIRFELAEERYQTWNTIINRMDVSYDAVKNTVIATEDVWEEICADHKLGEIYGGENEHMWGDLLEIFGPQSGREFGQQHRIPRIITDKVYTEEELQEEAVLMQAKFDDVKHLRRLVNDPQNKRFMGQTSKMPPEEVIPMPGNHLLRWEDNFNGTPEERMDFDKDPKAKRCLNF